MVSNVTSQPTTAGYTANYVTPDNRKAFVVVTPEFLQEHLPGFSIPLESSSLANLPPSKQFEALSRRHSRVKGYAAVYMTQKLGSEWGFIKGKRGGTETTDHLLIGDTKIPVTDFKRGMQEKFKNPSISDIQALPGGPLSLCYKLSILEPTKCKLDDSNPEQIFQNTHLLIPWRFFPKKYLSFRGAEDINLQGVSIENQLSIFAKQNHPDPVYMIEQDPQGHPVFVNIQGHHCPTIKITDDLAQTPQETIGLAIRVQTGEDPAVSPDIFTEALSAHQQDVSRATSQEPSQIPSTVSEQPLSLVSSACKYHNPFSRPNEDKAQHPTHPTLTQLFVDYFALATRWLHMLSTESFFSALNVIGYVHADDESTTGLYFQFYNFIHDYEMVSQQLHLDVNNIDQWLLFLKSALGNYRQKLPPLKKTSEASAPQSIPRSKAQKKRDRKKRKKESPTQPPVSELEFYHYVATFFEKVLEQSKEDAVEILKQLTTKQLCDIYDHRVEADEMEGTITKSLAVKIGFFEWAMTTVSEWITTGKEDIIDARDILTTISEAIQNKQYNAAWQAAKSLRTCKYITSCHQFIKGNPTSVLFSPENHHNTRLAINLLTLTNVLSDLFGQDDRIEIFQGS